MTAATTPSATPPPPELAYQGPDDDAAGEDGLPPGAGVDGARCPRDGIADLVARPEQHPGRHDLERNDDPLPIPVRAGPARARAPRLPR